MRRIENTRSFGAIKDGVQGGVYDLQVSTVAELPGATDTVQGRKVLPGSIAQVIQTGAFYTLDADGTWYDTEGNPNE